METISHFSKIKSNLRLLLMIMQYNKQIFFHFQIIIQYRVYSDSIHAKLIFTIIRLLSKFCFNNWPTAPVSLMFIIHTTPISCCNSCKPACQNIQGSRINLTFFLPTRPQSFEYFYNLSLKDNWPLWHHSKRNSLLAC